MIPHICIKLSNFSLLTFTHFDIYSYNHTEWFINVTNNLNQKDNFTINGIDNLKSLILLCKTELVMFISIELTSGFVLFNERCIINRELCLTSSFNIYISMDICKKSREIYLQNERLRKQYLKPIPQQVKTEIIKYI
jgi:hypothetical protein